MIRDCTVSQNSDKPLSGLTLLPKPFILLVLTQKRTKKFRRENIKIGLIAMKKGVLFTLPLLETSSLTECDRRKMSLF